MSRGNVQRAKDHPVHHHHHHHQEHALGWCIAPRVIPLHNARSAATLERRTVRCQVATYHDVVTMYTVKHYIFAASQFRNLECQNIAAF